MKETKNTFSSIAMNISITYRPDLLSSDEIKLSLFRKQNSSYIHKLINRRSYKKTPSINRVWFCIQQLWVHQHKHINLVFWFLIRIQVYQIQYLNKGVVGSNIGTNQPTNHRNKPTLSSCNYNVKNPILFSCMNIYQIRSLTEEQEVINGSYSSSIFSQPKFSGSGKIRFVQIAEFRKM